MSGPSTSDGANDVGRLLAEIHQLATANRRDPDREREVQLLDLRHRAGLAMLSNPHPHSFVAPDFDALPPTDGLPEIGPDSLTAGLVRAAILRHGALLVRGLVPRATASAMEVDVQNAFEARDRVAAGGPPAVEHYNEFTPKNNELEPYRVFARRGGGVFAADSPRAIERMFELLDDSGATQVANDYFGVRPLVSAHKTTLRRVTPEGKAGWHQDGSFMHNATALNLWIALTHCGDTAPGIDLVPRRLDTIVVSHEEMFDMEQAATLAVAAAGERGVIRPIFDPGDALFFDEMYLHRTACDPSMPNNRYALETWFFPDSAFPADYAPLAV